MKACIVRKFPIRKSVLIVYAIILSACSHDYQDLEDQLPSIEKFAPLAELLESHGNVAVIDLRHDPIRIEPPVLAEQVSEKWLEELKKSDLELIAYDSDFGGSLFVNKTYGIAISGSADGWVYFAKDELIKAAVVPDIDAYVIKAKEEKPNSVKADNLMVVKPINEHWGIFLHTY